MNIYEIKGNYNSELDGMVFGQFTTKELAEEGYKRIPEEIQGETFISQSNLSLNIIDATVDADGHTIDLTAGKSAEEIIASRDENNFVTGYVQVHISDVIDNDYEGFLDLLSENLVGSDLLMDISYDVVGIEDKNELIFKVSGDVSNILEAEAS